MENDYQIELTEEGFDFRVGGQLIEEFYTSHYGKTKVSQNGNLIIGNYNIEVLGDWVNFNIRTFTGGVYDRNARVGGYNVKMGWSTIEDLAKERKYHEAVQI